GSAGDPGLDVAGVSTVLTLNPGSSSLKASVRTPEPVLTIGVERIGTDRAAITTSPGGASEPFTGDLVQAVIAIGDQVRAAGQQIDVVAHRVVHGGPHHHRPTVVD